MSAVDILKFQYCEIVNIIKIFQNLKVFFARGNLRITGFCSFFVKIFVYKLLGRKKGVA